jgi:hypothetical protein
MVILPIPVREPLTNNQAENSFNLTDYKYQDGEKKQQVKDLQEAKAIVQAHCSPDIYEHLIAQLGGEDAFITTSAAQRYQRLETDHGTAKASHIATELSNLGKNFVFTDPTSLRKHITLLQSSFTFLLNNNNPQSEESKIQALRTAITNSHTALLFSRALEKFEEDFPDPTLQRNFLELSSRLLIRNDQLSNGDIRQLALSATAAASPQATPVVAPNKTLTIKELHALMKIAKAGQPNAQKAPQARVKTIKGCKIHGEHSTHSDAECYAQHPELKVAVDKKEK